MNGNYIPDVIVDILLKLPSKSVWRFRRVCKTWYDLISDPIFVKIHTKRAHQSPKILYSTPEPGSEFQLLDYGSSISFGDSSLSGPIKFPTGETYLHPKIVGSSCGLVCVATEYPGNSFTIWNPLTSECRKIPNLSMNINKHHFHGLGYDSVANDFKLVISLDTIKYNTFSLTANSWKIITRPLTFERFNPYHRQFRSIWSWNSLAIVLNGIFYWIVISTTNIEIVAFDVGNETFQKLQLPLRHGGDLNLLEHRGCLCASFSTSDSMPAKEVWMMKEYGTNWVHLLTIKNSTTFKYFELPVLCIYNASEVVYHVDEKFSMCGKEEEEKLNEKFRRHPYLYGQFHTLRLWFHPMPIMCPKITIMIM